MASSVFYKFKSQRDESRVTFDGTAISVFDLKKEIILANNLGKANDFDLYVYDASTNQGTSTYAAWHSDLDSSTPHLEYKDDSQLIPRSSSVVVKRMPSQRPGKGKAAMYIAGNNGNASIPTSEPLQRPGGGSTWHRGAMSKRFDGKDEPTPSKSSAPVRSCSKTDAPLANWRVLHSPQSSTTVTIPKNSVTKEDEAAAMAAMFQAQTANWEETQEKMSQLVSRLRGSPALCSRMKSHNMISVLPLDRNSAVRIYNNPRGTSFGRGGKPLGSHQSHVPDRPLPPSYVCYRCGQKGESSWFRHINIHSYFLGHWIQDCPTNSDREFDNKPRIKRTTGIPRSFLKAVENPNKGEIAQGVMVTPEGGYVVAQPDS